VIRDELVDRLGESQLSLRKHLCQELGMVNDLEFPSECGVFILERMETMRAHGHYFLDSMPVHHFDIAIDQDLKQVFVPDPSRRVSTTAFLYPQDAERNSAGLQNPHQRGCYFLIPIVNASSTPYPEEKLWLGPF
jgi:hypothetical protein